MGARAEITLQIGLIALAAVAGSEACVDSGRALRPIARTGTGGSGAVGEAGAPTAGDPGTVDPGAAGGGEIADDSRGLCDNPALCATCSVCRRGTLCRQELDTCLGSADCHALGLCLNGCATADCVEHCNGFYGDGRAALTALLHCLACACTDTCPVSGTCP